jgi:hypothetical protein
MATELEETVDLYRAAAKERDALRAAIHDAMWLDQNGKVHSTYQHHVDLAQKHPVLRCVLEQM